MPVARVAQTSADSGGWPNYAASQVVDVPSGSPGDLCVAYVWCGEGDTSHQMYPATVPSGFIRVDSDDIFYDFSGWRSKLSIWAKELTGSEGATFTFSAPSPNTYLWEVICVVYSGHDTTTPIDIYTVVSGTGNNPSNTGVTPDTEGALVAYLMHNYDGYATIATPSGTNPTFTDRYDLSGTGRVLYMADGVQSSAAATGTRSSTTTGNGGSAPWQTVMVVINAAVAAGTDLVEIVGETIASSESPDRSLAKARIRNETEGIVEGAVYSIAGQLIRTVGETLSLAEGAARALGLGRVIDETVALTETTVDIIAGALVKIIGETVELVEGTFDIVLVAIVQIVSEAVSIGEGVIRVLALVRSVAETVSATGAAQIAMALARSSAEALGISEAGAVSRGLARVASETVALSEAVVDVIDTIALEIVAVIDETISIAEHAVRTRISAIVVSETISIGDAAVAFLSQVERTLMMAAVRIRASMRGSVLVGARVRGKARIGGGW